MTARVEMAGLRFGRYTVLSAHGPIGVRKKLAWNCVCDCGSERVVVGENLRSGNSESCGCISKELCSELGKKDRAKHGQWGSPEYRAWHNMKSRAKQFGLSIHGPWRDFPVFLTDMGCKPSAIHELLRDGDVGSFNPENCYWGIVSADVERARARSEMWRALNRDHLRSRGRIYYQGNKGGCSQHARNRRARLLEAAGSHSAADIEAIFKAQRRRCGYCRIKLEAVYHIDHIVPLSRGGSNARSNLQILCPTCNLSKGSKDPIEYARYIGRLI